MKASGSPQRTRGPKLFFPPGSASLVLPSTGSLRSRKVGGPPSHSPDPGASNSGIAGRALGPPRPGGNWPPSEPPQASAPPPSSSVWVAGPVAEAERKDLASPFWKATQLPVRAQSPQPGSRLGPRRVPRTLTG